MRRLNPNAVPCINSGTTKKNLKRSTKLSKSKSIEDDLFASLKSKREVSDLESNDDTEETEIKVEQNIFDHMLDTESSEAVIDELSNQV